MPVEIKELEINTTIFDDGQTTSDISRETKEQIIDECIERLLQILKDKAEL